MTIASSIKTFPAITPSLRFTKLLKKNYDDSKKFKALCAGAVRSTGRDNHGHITSRYKGSGHKKIYRIVKFKWSKDEIDSVFKIIRFDYDPNRNVPLALIKNVQSNEYHYILKCKNLKIDDNITFFSKLTELKAGCIGQLKEIPVGTMVHSVELKPFKGAQIARSAGTYVQIVGKDNAAVILKMPSGETRTVQDTCIASIGSVDNDQFMNISIGKAGRNRWLGKRPHVRGVAMNPVDHPLGGGEGKTSGGRHPVSPWGKSAKGKKTRVNKRTSKFIITKRKK